MCVCVCACVVCACAHVCACVRARVYIVCGCVCVCVAQDSKWSTAVTDHITAAHKLLCRLRIRAEGWNPGHGGPIREVDPPLGTYNRSHLCPRSSEPLSSASIKRSNPTYEVKPVQQATMFMYRYGVKVYGPVNIPHQTCVITRKQQLNILNTCGIWPAIVEEFGIWVGSACTRQCRHALAIRRDLEC